jgi:hypothetical protein
MDGAPSPSFVFRCWVLGQDALESDGDF